MFFSESIYPCVCLHTLLASQTALLSLELSASMSCAPLFEPCLESGQLLSSLFMAGTAATQRLMTRKFLRSFATSRLCWRRYGVASGHGVFSSTCVCATYYAT